MKKISSLFARDANNPRVITRDYHQNAAWVVAGEGSATLKWDGTAVLLSDGKLWARYDAKPGKQLPYGFMPAQDPDPHTGHHPGWVPATRPEDRWIREAHDNSVAVLATMLGQVTWTYEAVGPKIGNNPERFEQHQLIPHGQFPLEDAPRTYDELVIYFGEHDIEGIVWWRDLTDIHCDKIKITGAALGVRRQRRSAP